MKTLSLDQPWASLVLWSEKEFETRGWRLYHRGLLAIHATRKNNRDTRLAIGQLIRFSSRLQMEEARLPYGAVLGIVRVLDCQPTTIIYPHISQRERAFGNYQPDRFAFRFEVVEVFPQPIPAVGKQSIWNWSRPA